MWDTPSAKQNDDYDVEQQKGRHEKPDVINAAECCEVGVGREVRGGLHEQREAREALAAADGT